MNRKPTGQFGPSVAILLGGCLWGLFWIPLRQIGDTGLAGAWPGLLIYLTVCFLLAPIAWLRRREFASQWQMLLLCGLFTGSAFTLYTVSIFLTDVIRVILLFYLTPIWSTILGWVFLQERLTANRILAILVGIVGMMVVLGIGDQFPWPANAGDWLALLSGILWSYGSLQLYRAHHTSASTQVFTFALGGAVTSLLFIAFGAVELIEHISVEKVKAALSLTALTSLFVIPMLYLTIWPAKVLSPGRVGLLLMTEVLVGTASAAYLTTETFGLREIIGTCLIVAAAIIELSGKVNVPSTSTIHTEPPGIE